MGVLCKADDYYGAFLSVLINGGSVPVLFGKENESRQTYEAFTTPTGSKDFTWSFAFTDRELA